MNEPVSPLFNILKQSTPVKLLLGSNPLRVYPWGEAPDKPRKPYAVYGTYNGIPENYLGNLPDIDNNGVQIDIYAETSESCMNCFKAIRNALELTNHMTSYSTPARDSVTENYNARLEFDLWEAR